VRVRVLLIAALPVLAIAVAAAKPLLALRVLTRLESRVAPRAWRTSSASPEATTCAPVVAAHRAYWQKGRYPQNSRSSLAATRSAGIRHVEIDVIILADSVVLDHGPVPLPARATLSDYRAHSVRPFTLDEFFGTFAAAFDRVVFDVKQVQTDPAAAVGQFRKFPLKRGHHYFVGLDCGLLQRLQHDLAIPAGCERLGVLGNRFSGFEIWSANAHNVNVLQLALNRWAGLMKLFWTYEDARDVDRNCDMAPDMVLVTYIAPSGRSSRRPAIDEHAAALLDAGSVVQPADASATGWTSPLMLSASHGWFPDLAADSDGTVHAIWARGEGLAYRKLQAGRWTPTTDVSDAIGAPQTAGDLVRAAIAVDRAETVHLLAATLGIGQATYVHSTSAAGSATPWTAAHQLGVQGAGYYCALATDSRKRVHALYIERPQGAEPADTFYRRSDDGGASWTEQVNLSNSPSAGSSRPQIIVDARDRIHVSWDEGWDRITGRGRIATSTYRWSSDGNEWSPPATFGSPNRPSAQLVVSPAPGGGRLAVWRSSRDDFVYFQVWANAGDGWTRPAPVPGVHARSWNSPPFDQYALAPDGERGTHLVLVGRQASAPGAPLQVIHLVWNGRQWTAPRVIFQNANEFPEYPRLAIGPRGVHVIWFARTDLWDSTSPKDIWYSEHPRAAPEP
jgi:hypothetical protein